MTAHARAVPARASSPEAERRLRAWLRILRAQRVIEPVLREKLRETHGLTLPRFDVLATLDRAPEGLRMSDLSAHLKVSNGNVTGIVDRLVSEGMVERAPVAGDRRANLVRLTAVGRARFAQMAADHEGWIDEIFGTLSSAELDTLIGLLSRIGREGTT